MRWLIYPLLTTLSTLFASCKACVHPKPHNKEAMPKEPTTVEGLPFTIDKVLDEIEEYRKGILEHNDVISVSRKTKRKTYYALASGVYGTRKWIDRSRRKLTMLKAYSQGKLEEDLAEKIKIGLEWLKEMEEEEELVELAEECEEWERTIASIFELERHEVKGYISWLYTSDTDGNFLIHKWADEDGKVPAGNPFVVEQTRDINCKNDKGLTALQIVISKLIATGETERREECVEKLGTLLRMGADITVVKPSSLQAALCILEAEYSQEESIINRLKYHRL
jgi:hypothetical protein